jgi:ATP-dependent Zn protease
MLNCDDSDDDLEEERSRTAYHEAGHCVVAVHYGAYASRASIAPEDDTLHGEVEIRWPSHTDPAKILSSILAGPVAEMIYRSEPLHPGLVSEWSQDWKQAWQIARRRTRNDQRCVEMLERMTRIVYENLSQDPFWSAVAAVQDLLMAHDEIEHEQILYEVRVWLQ